MDEKRILLQAEEVSKSYQGVRTGRKKRIDAVQKLSLKINEGECRGMVGESGCGKSTLLRLLSGLEAPDKGSVLYQGEPVCAQMKTKRNEIQMVFQNSFHAVNPYVLVEDILGEPLKNFGKRKGATKRERREWAGELLTRVGLSPGDLQKYPSQFSGGQLQRICIARALAAEPRVLLLDEPLSSLDVSVQAQMLRLLEKLGKEKGLTQVLVSHDLEAVYYLSDSLSVMYGGYIVEEIEEIALFDQLCHPYTKRLIQASKGEWIRIVPKVIDHSSREGCPYASMCPKSHKICMKETPLLSEISQGHWIRCFYADYGN